MKGPFSTLWPSECMTVDSHVFHSIIVPGSCSRKPVIRLVPPARGYLWKAKSLITCGHETKKRNKKELAKPPTTQLCSPYDNDYLPGPRLGDGPAQLPWPTPDLDRSAFSAFATFCRSHNLHLQNLQTQFAQARVPERLLDTSHWRPRSHCVPLGLAKLAKASLLYH